MNLQEKLQEMPANRILHIGSRSSFMLVGPKADILKQAGKADDHYFGILEKAARMACNSYERNMDIGHTREAEEDLRQYQKAMSKVQDYVPLMKRKVKTAYQRITDSGTVIIIEGEECGSYWSYSEMRAKRAGKCIS